MISVLGSKKAALGPPRYTLVMKIQKYNYNYKKYKYRKTKTQGMRSVLGSKKAAFGPPGCTLVVKGSRVWLRNTFLSKTVFTKIQKQLSSQKTC